MNRQRHALFTVAPFKFAMVLLPWAMFFTIPTQAAQNNSHMSYGTVTVRPDPAAAARVQGREQKRKAMEKALGINQRGYLGKTSTSAKGHNQ